MGNVPADVPKQLPKNLGRNMVHTDANREASIRIDSGNETLQTILRMVPANHRQMRGNRVDDAGGGELAHYFPLVCCVVRWIDYSVSSTECQGPIQ